MCLWISVDIQPCHTTRATFFVYLDIQIVSPSSSKIKQVPIKEPEEECQLLPSSADPVEAPARINKGNVLLLFTAAVLYDSAVVGAVDMLGAFEMKEPLSWTATQVPL